MSRKTPAKKSQPTASKKEASNVNASSKNPPAKPKRSASASKSKSAGNSIDALVKKQLFSAFGFGCYSFAYLLEASRP